MNRTLRAALAAFAIAFCCAPALAQSSFPTVGGSYVDGHALMCPNGSTDFQGRPLMVPCGGTSNPVQVNASVTASISGFTPTPSYASGTTSASDQTATLPTGTEFIIYNTGSNAASFNFGAAATGGMNIVQPGSWLAFAGTGGAALHYIEATGAAGTTTFVVSGGAGLPTGAGGGTSGGSGSNASVASTGGAAPGSATFMGIQSPGGLINAPNGSTWGSAPTGLLVVGVNSDVLSSALPTGAATAANQEVTVAGTSATSAQAVQGVSGGVPMPTSVVSLPLPSGAATAANQEVTAAGTSASSAQAVQGVTGGIPQSASVLAGNDVSEGNITDSAWSGSGNSTVVAALKAAVTGINAGYDSGTNSTRISTVSPYPLTAVPITASATGTTGATTATLTNVSGHTTYICGYSVRANATAATTVLDTVTGVITATMSSELWVAPAASGIGVDEQIFTPCIPASAVSTSIAVVSGAPGSGGNVSVKAWGFSL